MYQSINQAIIEKLEIIPHLIDYHPLNRLGGVTF